MPQRQRNARRPRAGKGTLFVVGALLVGSAIIRISDDAGKAFAVENVPKLNSEQPKPAAETCKTPDEYLGMLDALQERGERLKKGESQFRDRMHALSLADREVSRKLDELRKAEEELRATLAIAERAAEEDVAKLKIVYENMKPKDAALLFEEMDPEFAAGFLSRMRPDAAAGVMAGLSPKAAYTISVVMAGRNALVPTE